MAEIKITYEIERRDYAEANAAIFRRSRRTGLNFWAFLGSCILLLILPLTYKQPGIGWEYPYLVFPFAGYLLYLSILWASPISVRSFHITESTLPVRNMKHIFRRLKFESAASTLFGSINGHLLGSLGKQKITLFFTTAFRCTSS